MADIFTPRNLDHQNDEEASIGNKTRSNLSETLEQENHANMLISMLAEHFSLDEIMAYREENCPDIRLQDFEGFGDLLTERIDAHLHDNDLNQAIQEFNQLENGTDVSISLGFQLMVIDKAIECTEGGDVESAIKLSNTLGRDIDFAQISNFQAALNDALKERKEDHESYLRQKAASDSPNEYPDFDRLTYDQIKAAFSEE